jgi:hypothetical protein
VSRRLLKHPPSGSLPLRAKPAFIPNSEVGEHARPGRCWSRLAASTLRAILSLTFGSFWCGWGGRAPNSILEFRFNSDTEFGVVASFPIRGSSCGAAKAGSPRREPWVCSVVCQAPAGANDFRSQDEFANKTSRHINDPVRRPEPPGWMTSGSSP